MYSRFRVKVRENKEIHAVIKTSSKLLHFRYVNNSQGNISVKNVRREITFKEWNKYNVKHTTKG